MKANNQPLYCFKPTFREGKCFVEKYVIPDWTRGEGKYAFIFNGRKYGVTQYSNDYISFGRLDRYVHGKVYTFNPDADNALTIIHEDMIRRKEDAAKALQKWSDTVEKWDQLAEDDQISIVRAGYQDPNDAFK